MWGEIKMTWHYWLGTCCWIIAWTGKRLSCRDPWSSINVLKHWWVFSGGRRSTLERPGMGASEWKAAESLETDLIFHPVMIVGGFSQFWRWQLTPHSNNVVMWGSFTLQGTEESPHPSLPLVQLSSLTVIYSNSSLLSWLHFKPNLYQLEKTVLHASDSTDANKKPNPRISRPCCDGWNWAFSSEGCSPRSPPPGDFLAQQFLCRCHISPRAELWPPQHGNQIQENGVFPSHREISCSGASWGSDNGPWPRAAAPRQLFSCHTTCPTRVRGSISAASAVSHCSSVGEATFSSYQLKACTGLEHAGSTEINALGLFREKKK